MKNEIHVEIGELYNTEKPNSKDNTVCFQYFETKDYRSNMKVGLTRLITLHNKLKSKRERQVSKIIK